MILSAWSDGREVVVTPAVVGGSNICVDLSEVAAPFSEFWCVLFNPTGLICNLCCVRSWHLPDES